MASRKETVKQIHDLTAKRILAILQDESKVIRGSTMSTIVQFLKLNGDELQRQQAEEERESPEELARKLRRDIGNTELRLFENQKQVAPDPDDDLGIPFTAEGDESDDF